MSSDILVHHGIKGQRWGIRRYQNADGTLTEAGKKRYGSQLKYDIDKSIKESKNKKIGVQTKTVDSDFKKKVSSLRAKADSAADEYDKLIKTAEIEGKIASKRPEFKKSFEKKWKIFWEMALMMRIFFNLRKMFALETLF